MVHAKNYETYCVYINCQTIYRVTNLLYGSRLLVNTQQFNFCVTYCYR